MEKKKYLVMTALALAVLTVTATSAFAQDTKPARLTDEERQARFEEMQVEREKIETAVEAGDYDTWYSLMTANDRNPEILEVITKDNFAKFSKAHQLMAESRQILSDLGVEKMGGFGFEGKGGPEGRGRHGGPRMMDEGEAAEVVK
ncbi:hypothetical protein M0P48_03135 [Candidatus Gracilibacteria bacterium]|nr:hypothetical protein [Candidatus Gracilibacteria bacterium]